MADADATRRDPPLGAGHRGSSPGDLVGAGPLPPEPAPGARGMNGKIDKRYGTPRWKRTRRGVLVRTSGAAR
jgi:hypothetical protein